MTGKQNRTLLIFILCLTAAAAIVAFNRKIPTSYGLDIKGGVRVVLRAKTEEYARRQNKAWTDEKLEAVRTILERRVNATGVSEPTIVTKPPDQIIVELPGLKDEKEAVDRLQSTASLQFYILRQLGDKNNSSPATWREITRTNARGEKEEVLLDASTRQPVSDAQLEASVFSNDPAVTGEDLLPQCKAEIQTGTNQPIIAFQFNDKGSHSFEDTTRANQGRFLAIFLDKKLLSAPTINSVIPGGSGIIEGNFTLESAKALADQMNAGALPVPLEILEQRKLEATLGAEAVAATTIAGTVGLGLVLVFMLWFYRLPGVLADVALVLYSIFTLALFKLWPITLTLPGIAGFILSIGMAVDANILIFERMKEELKSGKSLRNSIDAGFKRAFTAILDSNVCTLITCAVLYNFGTGPIRGFAITLGLGVLVSMFTAITVTRTFLFTLVGFGAAQNPRLFGLNPEKERSWNLHVMRRKPMWVAISLLIIVPGLIAWGAGGIKPSIDFRGGTELQIPFAQRHSADQIQKALAQVNPRYRDSRVVVADGAAGESHLAYVTTEPLNATARLQVQQALISNVGPLANGETLTKLGYANVSGTISRELTFNAVQAVIFASVLIVLFLAVRFAIGGFMEGLKYGTCAVIALLHDVAVVWGAFALLGLALNWQVDSLFVTAMLTVIGFSVHDTIIVFDRMRENLQHRQKGESFSDLADRSIDQTFTRSLRTSFTVVLVLTALFFFGGGQIHQFVGALLIGIISGTYSSIFNASVLLVWWKQRDTGIAYAGGPRPQSAIGPRPANLQPGDRPLMTPRPQSEGGSRAVPTTEGGAAALGGGESGGARPTPRRQPVRRRRM